MVTKTSSHKARDIRNKRPTTREEIAVLQEALAPIRRAYIKLSGNLAPSTNLWDSYAMQVTALQRTFEQVWTQVYDDVPPPQLPSLSSWKGGILGLTSSGSRSGGMSVIRRFDADSYEKLDTSVQSLRDKCEGPFSTWGDQAPATRAVSRRNQGANMFCLNHRRAFFTNRPALTNATEAQKWCLSRLRQSWKEKRQDANPTMTTSSLLPKPTDISHGAPIALTPTDPACVPPDPAGDLVEKALCKEPDEFYAWLHTTGRNLWAAHWQHMTPKEFCELIAPIAFTATVYDDFPKLSEPVDQVEPGSSSISPDFRRRGEIVQNIISKGRASRRQDVSTAWDDEMLRP